jgi:ubiquinone biosynthesis protein COQ9
VWSDPTYDTVTSKFVTVKTTTIKCHHETLENKNDDNKNIVTLQFALSLLKKKDFTNAALDQSLDTMSFKGPLCPRHSYIFIPESFFVSSALLLFTKGYSLANHLNHIFHLLLS